MRQQKTNVVIVIYYILMPFLVLAETADDEEGKFSARLQAGAYYLQTDSQLYVSDDNAQNNNLNNSAETYDEFQALASLYLEYRFKNGTTLYAGNPLEIDKDLALSAGVIQPLGKSSLDVSLVWTPIDEVWANPYQVGTARTETDMDALGLRVKFQQIAGSPWEGYYHLDSTTIKDDEIGNLDRDLRRSGYAHALGLKYTFALNESFSIRPEAGYAYGDLDGASNSYQGFQLGALVNYQHQFWMVSGQVFGICNQYDKVHSIFGETRDETGFVAMAQVTRMNLFKNKYLFANCMAGYASTDANIDFFDQQTALCLLSLGINY